MDTNEELFMILDDTVEHEFFLKYGNLEPPITEEDEKIFKNLKRRLKNGDFNLK